jgi:hypothetical protein
MPYPIFEKDIEPKVLNKGIPTLKQNSKTSPDTECMVCGLF